MNLPKSKQFLALYKGKQLLIEAKNSIDAHYQAIDLFEASKPEMISIKIPTQEDIERHSNHELYI